MIDIIVPVYNNLDYTRLFIDSLDYQKDSEFSLIVIDNASSDGTRSFLKKLKKNYSIQIIYNDENLGYVKAINQGLKLCKNNIILFSNNDTILSSNLLSQMERNMGKYGILTPYTNALDGKDSNILLTPYTGKPILSEINVYAESLYLEFGNKISPIEFSYGHCMMISCDTFYKVGFLDESFGMGNYDDIDFCKRAMIQGVAIGLMQGCFVYHFCHTTFNTLGINLEDLLNQNYLIFKDKWN